MSTTFDAMTPDQRVLWLSDELGLANESQDWGIINADAGRLGEFIGFLETQPLASTQVFEMIELIIASANELLLEDPSADLATLDVLLSRRAAAAASHVGYWRALDGPEEFPIGAWLRDRVLPRSPPET